MQMQSFTAKFPFILQIFLLFSKIRLQVAEGRL
jgi:hypothetical protein